MDSAVILHGVVQAVGAFDSSESTILGAIVMWLLEGGAKDHGEKPGFPSALI